MDSGKRILVTGGSGQLGRELRALFGDRADYPTHSEVDFADADAAEAYLRSHDCGYVVNCAAYTAVDRAEEEKLECARANIELVENLARLADELDYKIVHISTDYVFDGTSCRPYTESDRPEPLSVYGSTKRKGETALLGLAPESIIIRTGWLYSAHGHNFVKTVLDVLGQGRRMRVVDDQTGTPTSAADLAAFIADNVLGGHWSAGIYHYADEGVASWYDFAVAIAEEAGIAGADITPVHSKDYPTAATRPQYAVLDKAKVKAAYGISIPHWRASLRRCIHQLTTTASTNG